MVHVSYLLTFFNKVTFERINTLRLNAGTHNPKQPMIQYIAVVLAFLVISCNGAPSQAPDPSEPDSPMELYLKSQVDLLSDLLNQGRLRMADSVSVALLDSVSVAGNPDQQLRAVIERSFILLSTGRYAEALDLMENAPARNHPEVQVRTRDIHTLRTATIMVELSRVEEAVQLTEPIVERYRRENPGDQPHFLALTTLANMMEKSYRFEEAVAINQEALRMADAAGISQRNIAVIHNNLGLILTRTGQYREALEELSRSYEINTRNNIPAGLAQNLNNIANVYGQTGQAQAAIDSLRSAVRYQQESGNTVGLIRNYYNLASSLMDAGDYDEALTYLQEGLGLSREINLSPGIMFHNYGLGRWYLETEDYTQLPVYANRALEWSERLGNLELQVGSNRYLAAYYEQKGDFRTALDYQKAFGTLSDSLNTAQNQQAVEQVRSEFALDLINTENDLLREQLALKEQQERNRKNILLGLVAFAVVVALLLLMIIRQNSTIRRKNATLQEFNEYRDNLVNMIVHDLRNPLSALVSSLDMIRDLHATTDTDFNDIYAIAEHSSEKLRLMIDGLLDIKSIQNVDISGKMESVDIEEATQIATDSYLPAALQKNISLQTELQPLEALTHPEYYARIVENLVSNAIKYSYPDSRVRVRTGYGEAGYWFLEVGDQGQGFSEADKAQAFEMFSKLSARPTDNEPSSGLGLHVVKLLVKKLGGEIQLESEKDKGSVFTCTFPIRPVIGRPG